MFMIKFVRSVLCLGSFLLGCGFTQKVMACEIAIAADKQEYALQDIAVLTVTITDNHRSCTFTGKEPKTKTQGLEVTAKTKYKELKTGVWSLKYKVKIVDAKNLFTAFRDNCPSGGGMGSLALKIQDGQSSQSEVGK